jgi:hypothetical protein
MHKRQGNYTKQIKSRAKRHKTASKDYHLAEEAEIIKKEIGHQV